MNLIHYDNIIGSIMYTTEYTTPDLSYAISVTSQHMAQHGIDHLRALKWILIYLRSSANHGILYKRVQDFREEALIEYCDSDYAVNLDNRKSQTGYILNLYGSAVSWKLSLQSIVALSTTKTTTVKESMWLKVILGDFGISQNTVSINCDSDSALCLAKHQIFYEKGKHIDVRLHFIRGEVEKGNVRLIKVDIDHDASDMLKKSLSAFKFSCSLELVNVLEH